jgi:hypothetical protein
MVLSRMASLQVSATGPRPSVIRMKMSTEPRTASPTLSDMDFDSPKLISPVPNRTPGPDAQLIPRVDESPPRQQARPHRSTPKQRLTRFLTTDKRDAFIAALPPTIAVGFSPSHTDLITDEA